MNKLYEKIHLVWLHLFEFDNRLTYLTWIKFGMDFTISPKFYFCCGFNLAAEGSQNY